ncbi:MAG: putative Ig domain-containing protein, partial [Sneathiellales bacterium]|nr:putative Ig domain-containing protein [Sneathiellales bacterium]
MAIDGTSGNDTLDGTSAAEELNGLAGDDLITGGSGDDTIDGGDNTDTAVFSGNFADYTITYNDSNDSWTVSHDGGGSDGTDTLTNIEFLQFADQTVSTSLSAVPTIDQGISNQQIAEDSALSFVVPSDAFDESDPLDALTYSANLAGGGALPSWLSFDGTTFSGIPLNENVGTLSIEVTATDLFGNTATTTFDLDVTNTNDAPVIDQGIGTQNATEDAAFSFAIPSDAFDDVDVGDSLTYTASLTGGAALPTWLSFDGTSFSGTPINDDVAVLSVDVTATDGSGATVTETFTLNVINTNDAPTVDQGIG